MVWQFWMALAIFELSEDSAAKAQNANIWQASIIVKRFFISTLL
jgi:hypothetical protein